MSEGGSSGTVPSASPALIQPAGSATDAAGTKLLPRPSTEPSSSSASPSSIVGESNGRAGSNGGNSSSSALGRRPSGLAAIENVVVEQGVVSAAEEQAALDRVLPVIGVLVGSAPPENSCAIVKSLWRIQRDASSLLERRRIAPADIMTTVNRRIRDEGSMILGYYFCSDADEPFGPSSSLRKGSADEYLETIKEPFGYCVDHGALMTAVLQTDCPRPIVMQLRRILATEGDVEASIRLDFFAAVGAEPASESPPSSVRLRAIPHRLMDSAYPSVTLLKSLLESDLVAMEEATSVRDHCGGRDGRMELEYHRMLSRILGDAERRSTILLWNVQTRLASETLHLKQLIYARMSQIELLWRHHKSLQSSLSPSSSAEASETSEGAGRLLELLTQLVSKELPSAAADTLRKLPVSSHLAFYDRPTISMKSTRSTLPTALHPTPALTLGRKRKPVVKMVGTTAKGPPRPILPAQQLPGEPRSRTPSTESLTSLVHSTLSLMATKTSEEHPSLAPAPSPSPPPPPAAEKTLADSTS